jgi:hypothetical protein
VGSSGRKVLLADNFYRYPDQVTELALNLYYTESRSLIGSYPGARALITLNTEPLIETLGSLWGEPLIPYHSDYHPVIFSAILNRNYPLTPWQRQPHIDQGITAMIYLNPAELCAGGTGLYRHRPTGLDRIPIELTADFIQLAEQHGVSAEALRSPEGYAEFLNSVIFNPDFATKDNTFINDGNEFWELLFLIEMKPNRLVIFDGRQFHSQYILPGHFQEFYRITQILYFRGHD